MTDLDRSYAELRAILLVAGKEVRKLNFGGPTARDPIVLRRVLRDARVVAGQQGLATRIRLRLPTERS
jgi:hypothetical protein